MRRRVAARSGISLARGGRALRQAARTAVSGNAAEGACSLPARHALSTMQRRAPRAATRFSCGLAQTGARWVARARGGVR